LRLRAIHDKAEQEQDVCDARVHSVRLDAIGIAPS
jgi:hypothetical protein